MIRQEPGSKGRHCTRKNGKNKATRKIKKARPFGPGLGTRKPLRRLFLPQEEIKDHPDERQDHDQKDPEELLPRGRVAFQTIHNGNDVQDQND